MGRIGWSDIKDAVFPASGSAKAIIKSGSGHLDAYGDEKPADGSTGYAKGSTFKDTTDGRVYVNEGSNTSSSFSELYSSDRLTEGILDGVQNKGTAAGRGPSPLIWDDCPILDFKLDPTQGWEWFDDFIVTAPVLAAAQTVTIQGDWACCTDGTAGSTLAPQVDAREGEVVLSCTTIDEDIIMSALNGRHNTGQVTFEAGKKTWFEARIHVTNVTDAKSAVFCGFAEEGLVVNGTMLDTDQAVVDKDFVGFAQLPANGDAWQTLYNTAGGGVNGTAVSATADVIVTTVYAKLGIYCDGETVYFYADGVLLADSVTLATAGFPDGEEMAFYFALGNVDGADTVCGIDWVRVAQEH